MIRAGMPNPTIQEIFGRWLALEMKRRGMEQGVLARRLGFATEFVGQLMRAEKNPSVKSINQILDALEMPVWAWARAMEQAAHGDDVVIRRGRGRPRKVEVPPLGVVERLSSVREISPPLVSMGSVRLYRVAAGRGIEAVREADEIEVPVGMVKSLRNCYALTVQGNSMTGDGIRDGDVVLVRKNPEPSENVIAVVRRMSSNEVTLKRIHRRGDHVELVPSNPADTPFTWPAKDVIFDGVFVGILRRR